MISNDLNFSIGDISYSPSPSHSDDTWSSLYASSQEVDGLFGDFDSPFENFQSPHTLPPYEMSPEGCDRIYSDFSSPESNPPFVDLLTSDSEGDDLDKPAPVLSSPTMLSEDKEACAENEISAKSFEQKRNSDELSLTGKRKYVLKLRGFKKRKLSMVQWTKKDRASGAKRQRKTDRISKAAAKKNEATGLAAKEKAAKKAAERKTRRKAAAKKAEKAHCFEGERLEPLDRDPSMKFFGIQCQNKNHKGKRVGFVSRRFCVSHENALCAVLKKEYEQGYDKLPRHKRIFKPKITPDMSGTDFKNLHFECENIITDVWWHAQYNSDEFLSKNYWSSNLFLMSDLKKDRKVLAQKHAILSGYKINGVWKSIRFGRGRVKRKPAKKDENSWKNNFHGDPFFHPDKYRQESPKVALNEIQNVLDSDQIQLRVLEFTKTAQFGKPGNLKPVSQVLPGKIRTARRMHDSLRCGK